MSIGRPRRRGEGSGLSRAENQRVDQVGFQTVRPAKGQLGKD